MYFGVANFQPFLRKTPEGRIYLAEREELKKICQHKEQWKDEYLRKPGDIVEWPVV